MLAKHFVILRHLQIMEAKSSSQMDYFWRFFNRMFSNCIHVNTPTSAFLFTSEREIIFKQIVANLPQNATGIVRTLKTFKI